MEGRLNDYKEKLQEISRILRDFEETIQGWREGNLMECERCHKFYREETRD